MCSAAPCRSRLQSSKVVTKFFCFNLHWTAQPLFDAFVKSQLPLHKLSYATKFSQMEALCTRATETTRRPLSQNLTARAFKCWYQQRINSEASRCCSEIYVQNLLQTPPYRIERERATVNSHSRSIPLKRGWQFCLTFVRQLGHNNIIRFA